MDRAATWEDTNLNDGVEQQLHSVLSNTTRVDGEKLGKAVDIPDIENFSCATLHHQTRGYLVMKNKLEVLEKLGKLSEARPEEIPEESRFLLEIDFRGLVTSRLDRQVYWIAAMQAAIKAGRDKRFQWKRKGRMPRAAASRTTRAEELSHVRHRKIICSMFAQEVASRKRVCTTQSGTSKYRRTD